MKFQMKKLGGKAATLAASDPNTVGQLGKTLASPGKPDEFADTRTIPVDAIRPDPDQPRQLHLTMEMLLNPESVTVPDQRQRVETIIAMSSTLKDAGQQAAIEVYRDGSMYRLVYGERRYWAARVAGIKTLSAKILPQKPERLRLKQYLENASREDLSSMETMHILQDVLDETRRLDEAATAEAKREGRVAPTKRTNTLTEFKALTGMPNATASEWWAIVSGPADVQKALSTGKLGTRLAAARAAREPDAKVRAELIETLAAAEKVGGTQTAIAASAAKRAVQGGKRKVGRPGRIEFGSTMSEAVAHLVLERLLGRKPPKIDWSDRMACKAAFADAVAALEKAMAG